MGGSVWGHPQTRPEPDFSVRTDRKVLENRPLVLGGSPDPQNSRLRGYPVNACFGGPNRPPSGGVPEGCRPDRVWGGGVGGLGPHPLGAIRDGVGWVGSGGVGWGGLGLELQRRVGVGHQGVDTLVSMRITMRIALKLFCMMET